MKLNEYGLSNKWVGGWTSGDLCSLIVALADRNVVYITGTYNDSFVELCICNTLTYTSVGMVFPCRGTLSYKDCHRIFQKIIELFEKSKSFEVQKFSSDSARLKIL